MKRATPAPIVLLLASSWLAAGCTGSMYCPSVRGAPSDFHGPTGPPDGYTIDGLAACQNGMGSIRVIGRGRLEVVKLNYLPCTDLAPTPTDGGSPACRQYPLGLAEDRLQEALKTGGVIGYEEIDPPSAIPCVYGPVIRYALAIDDWRTLDIVVRAVGDVMRENDLSWEVYVAVMPGGCTVP